jgi:Fe-S oxidoreductase/nitrate reductase gamma subunit
MWNVESLTTSILMYASFTLALAICCFGIWRRFRFWSEGLDDSSRFNNRLKRFLNLAYEVCTQHSLNKESRTRAYHGLMATGFLVLTFATTVVFLDYDLGLEIFRGPFYLAVSLLADLFGLALLVGVALAYHHRFLEGHDRLHRTKIDAAVLFLLGLLAVQGFLLEALRIAATTDPWAIYSPVGLLLSKAFWGLSPLALRTLHAFLWWIHTLSAFLFIALIPYTRLLHILTSTANIYFRQIERPKGALAYPGDIEKMMEQALSSDNEQELNLGASSLGELSWKQRLDLDACTSCGRCQDACPAYRSGTPLSPKWLILDIRDHSLALQTNNTLFDQPSALDSSLFGRIDGSLLKKGLLCESAAQIAAIPADNDNNYSSQRASSPAVQNAPYHLGGAIEDEFCQTVLDPNVFWSCTTCRACMEACPVAIDHVDLIEDVRRAEVLMHGRMPAEAQTALRNLESRNNPFGSSEDRTAWTKGLNVRVLAEGEQVDILYWVGCTAAFDPRKQNIAKAMAKILNVTGASWGILGNREQCNGDPARRLGEELLFQSAAKEVIATLKSISFKTLVTHCPHCFNTFKNEYPQIDSWMSKSFHIVHHAEFINELINNGQLTIETSPSTQYTYHDPCYLGRYNDQYGAPRTVVQSVTGSPVREMSDSKDQALCCGAGGGHYWMDLKLGDRINTQRTQQALQTGSKTIATACPFCMHMLEDGIGLLGKTEELTVQDIAELVAYCV